MSNLLNIESIEDLNTKLQTINDKLIFVFYYNPKERKSENARRCIEDMAHRKLNFLFFLCDCEKVGKAPETVPLFEVYQSNNKITFLNSDDRTALSTLITVQEQEFIKRINIAKQQGNMMNTQQGNMIPNNIIPNNNSQPTNQTNPMIQAMMQAMLMKNQINDNNDDGIELYVQYYIKNSYGQMLPFTKPKKVEDPKELITILSSSKKTEQPKIHTEVIEDVKPSLPDTIEGYKYIIKNDNYVYNGKQGILIELDDAKKSKRFIGNA